MFSTFSLLFASAMILPQSAAPLQAAADAPVAWIEDVACAPDADVGASELAWGSGYCPMWDLDAANTRYITLQGDAQFSGQAGEDFLASGKAEIRGIYRLEAFGPQLLQTEDGRLMLWFSKTPDDIGVAEAAVSFAPDAFDADGPADTTMRFRVGWGDH